METILFVQYLGPLGNNIRSKRKTAKLSQRKLALEAGVSKPLLGGIELGHCNPTVATLAKIAKALNCTIHDFFKPSTSLV